MKQLLNLLNATETGIKKLKKTLTEKDELKDKLLLAQQALNLIAHTTCPEHPDCGNARLLQSIAKDALEKLN